MPVRTHTEPQAVTDSWRGEMETCAMCGAEPTPTWWGEGCAPLCDTCAASTSHDEMVALCEEKGLGPIPERSTNIYTIEIGVTGDDHSYRAPGEIDSAVIKGLSFEDHHGERFEDTTLYMFGHRIDPETGDETFYAIDPFTIDRQRGHDTFRAAMYMQLYNMYQTSDSMREGDQFVVEFRNERFRFGTWSFHVVDLNGPDTRDLAQRWAATNGLTSELANSNLSALARRMVAETGINVRPSTVARHLADVRDEYEQATA